MKRTHYAWAVCLSCTLLLICTIGFSNNILPMYLPYLERLYLTGSQGSTTISIRCLFGIVGMLFVEQYYNCLTLRWGLVATCLITAAGFICFSLAKTVTIFFVAAAICGLGYGLGSMIPVAILMRNWFTIKRSTAIGVCTAGSGISMVLFPPLITFLIENCGISKTYIFQSLFIVLVGLCVALVVRDKPEQLGKEPFGGLANNTENPHAEVKEVETVAYKDVQGIWIIRLVTLLIGSVAASAPGHLSVYFVTEGYNPLKIAFGVSMFGLALTLGKLFCGMTFDKYGARTGSSLFSLIAFVGCVICCFANGIGYFRIYLGMALFGCGMATATLGISGWAADFSNNGDYNKALKWIQIIYSTGGMLFSSIPGHIYDISGSYKIAYILMAIILMLEVFCIQIAYSIRKGNRNNA